MRDTIHTAETNERITHCYVWDSIWIFFLIGTDGNWAAWFLKCNWLKRFFYPVSSIGDHQPFALHQDLPGWLQWQQRDKQRPQRIHPVPYQWQQRNHEQYQPEREGRSHHRRQAQQPPDLPQPGLLPVSQAHPGPVRERPPRHQECQLQSGARLAGRALPVTVQYEVHDQFGLRALAAHPQRGARFTAPNDGRAAVPGHQRHLRPRRAAVGGLPAAHGAAVVLPH